MDIFSYGNVPITLKYCTIFFLIQKKNVYNAKFERLLLSKISGTFKFACF